jgi:6-phosphogluconolactonase (cycloisomerase 2 family)
VLYSIEKGGQLKPRQALGLPRPTWIDQSTSPHPHHIAQHPRDSRTFYVPDLGYNVVYVLRETRSRVKTSLGVVQTFDTKAYGQGPRNGVVSQNGTSCSILWALLMSRENVFPFFPDFFNSHCVPA